MRKALVIIYLAIFLIHGVTTAFAEEVYKIGAILPLTGGMASFGDEMRKGQSLVVELINSNFFGKQEIKLKVVFEDGKGIPNDSISAYRKAKLDGIDFFTSTLSPVCLAILPIALQDKVLFFADAAHPSISNSGEYIFRHSSTAPQEAKVLVEFLSNGKGRTATVVVVNNDYGIAFKDGFAKFAGQRGIAVKNKIEYPIDEKDFKSVALKATKHKPDTVVICGVGSGVGVLIRRLREYKYNGLILCTNTFGYPEAQNAVGSAGKGVYYIAFDFDREDKLFKRVNEEFKKRYGSDMSDLSILEFNTIFLLSNAFNQVGYDISKVANYLKSIKEYRGVGETMRIEKSGDIMPKIKVIKKDL